jgi:hypothetical protein
MSGERGLPNGRATTSSLSRQEKISDVSAAIHRAIDADRLVRSDDGDVRRAKQPEVLERLTFIGGAIAARNPHGIAQAKSAVAAAGEIGAAVLRGNGKSGSDSALLAA